MKILKSYKKIAKSMLIEHAWERKVGKPLPTLEDVMKEAEMKLQPKGGGKTVIFKDKDNYEKAKKSGDYEDPEETDDSGEEEPSGKLGTGDFDRDSGDGDDKGGEEPKAKPTGKTDTDIDYVDPDDIDDLPEPEDEEPSGEPDEKPSSEPVEREPQDDTTQQAADYEDFFGKDENEELRLKMDDDGASFWLHKAENLQYLKDNPEFAEKQMADWSPEVLDYYKDNIDSEKEESITINGKQYIPIKDSVEPKKHLLRETYERIGGK